MLFNSWEFFVLLLITFGLYYIPALQKLQIPILIAASLVFYGYHQPVLLLLLMLSILINAVSSYGVFYGRKEQRLLWASLGVVVNLAILAFFKYSSLVYQSLFGHEGDIALWLSGLPLPLGISFFTFQGISLVVDVYREKQKGEGRISIEKNFGKHLFIITFFKAFFPQLVAGPIVKAYDFLPQIKRKLMRDIPWDSAFKLLTMGYFLKMVVADNMKDQTFWIAYPYFQLESSVTLAAMLFGYSMQIFADFAGYSLIALGLAALFGYRMPHNFNFPYISTSLGEFWRRWHISLSTWLKEYLYIALGGNRKGKTRTYINLFLVMVLGGLWHGAAWSYAIWGAWHGGALAIERAVQTWLKKRKTKTAGLGTIPPEVAGRIAATSEAAAEKHWSTPFLKGLYMLLVFTFVTIGWLLFKLPEFHHVILYVSSIATNFHRGIDFGKVLYILIYSLPVIVYHMVYLIRQSKGQAWGRRLEPLFYAVMLFFILLNSGDAGEFIYFQF
ncbi:membrane bound O-acyl transferase MBOAT family protein [Paenibacillus mucilaginosus 3016]|uniref:Membrane bound O-acyl transferase MBOAT family protein n=2 Tax=Paenibacillus mucilaginosus TaxID=61624 RepID=H6NE18_9BACL|nr:membrane bound O-acyl transferase MBOAT family protein [Paenibacillus mucilaginosus KNP414]AFC32971.1 membrane bound O-acyl transferase MBOAT family protein [Paenibacillus mucilaginosus 3016]WDM26705.1 MBOAT family protein [Paenibacillus mucilaginosus]WFA21417.1 MBOAT family protein [Paenibacillus mucilaginosus]